MLDNPVSEDFVVTVDGYASSEPREGIITLSYGDVKSELRVVQSGSEFKLSQYSLDFKAEENLTQRIYMSGNLNYMYITADIPEDANWVSVQIDWGSLTVTVLENPFEQGRDAAIKLYYRGLEIGELRISQAGAVPHDRYVYFESSASNYTLSFPVTEGATITSSADWCTATPNGATLVIRATSTTEDRWAEISVEGISSKIYVSQSKYKIDATYSEGAVTGTVYKMENGVGYIYKQLEGRYAWSTENVDIKGATDMKDGLKNTEAIKAIPGWQELYPVFAAVDALNVDEATGWYLPAKEEFQLYYSYTWYSTQYDATIAWFYNYGADTGYKSATHAAIAVNRFNYDFVPR